MINVLVVCSGNICRSPLAAALIRQRGLSRGLELEVRSAGTLGLVNRPAHPKTMKVSEEIQLTFKHKSSALTSELCDWADHIVVMEPQHSAWIAENTPSGCEKVVPFGAFIGKSEIEDPVDSWFLFTFRRTRDEIVRATDSFLSHLEQQV